MSEIIVENICMDNAMHLIFMTTVRHLKKLNLTELHLLMVTKPVSDGCANHI
jgi:hypothetical protein